MSTESVSDVGVALMPVSLTGSIENIAQPVTAPMEDSRRDRDHPERMDQQHYRSGRRNDTRHRSRSPEMGRRDNYKRRGGGYQRSNGNDRYMSATQLDALVQQNDFYREDAPMAFGEFVALVGPAFDAKMVSQKYDDYIHVYKARQVQVFFQVHKDEAWFRERYHPELLKELKLTITNTYKLNSELFNVDYQSDMFNNLSLDEPADGLSAPSNNGMIVDGESLNTNHPLLTNPLDTSMRTPVADTTVDDIRVMPQIIDIINIPANLERKVLENALSQDPAFLYFSLSEPVAEAEFTRQGWMALTTGHKTTEVIQRIKQLEVPVGDGSTTVSLETAIYQPIKRNRITAEIANTPTRIRHDFLQVRHIVDRFDKEFSLSHPITMFRDNKGHVSKGAGQLCSSGMLEAGITTKLLESYDIDLIKAAMDLFLVYLRRVYFFDYYAMRERTDSAEDFMHRVGTHTFRRQVRAGSDEDHALGKKWAVKLDELTGSLLKGLDYTSLRLLGYKSIEAEMESFANRHIERVEEHKHRCKVGTCAKLFKGPEFVKKHIANKHAAELKAYENDIEFFNNYVCDAFKLTHADQFRGKNLKAERAALIAANQQKNDRSPRYVDLDAPKVDFDDINYN